jgi:hypothetical protein
VVGGTINYTAMQIDGTPNDLICEQTSFCPTDVVRHTVVDSASDALDQEHYMIRNEASSPSRGGEFMLV